MAQEGLVLNSGIFLGVFYAKNGMIGARYSEWLQNALNVLVGLFHRYGIVTNVAKFWTMTCQPKSLKSGMLEEVVGPRYIFLVASYRE